MNDIGSPVFPIAAREHCTACEAEYQESDEGHPEPRARARARLSAVDRVHLALKVCKERDITEKGNERQKGREP